MAGQSIGMLARLYRRAEPTINRLARVNDVRSLLYGAWQLRDVLRDVALMFVAAITFVAAIFLGVFQIVSREWYLSGLAISTLVIWFVTRDFDKATVRSSARLTAIIDTDFDALIESKREFEEESDAIFARLQTAQDEATRAAAELIELRAEVEGMIARLESHTENHPPDVASSE